MIKFDQERLSAFREEAKELFAAHYDEVAQFKSLQKLDPDWVTYDLYEKMGKLWSMTARDDGVLVGYIIMIVSTHLHYRQLRSAMEDVHFIHPDYRKGLVGYKLIKAALQQMRNLGVSFCVMRTKADQDHGKLFERLGGVKHDIVYAFDLTEG